MTVASASAHGRDGVGVGIRIRRAITIALISWYIIVNTAYSGISSINNINDGGGVFFVANAFSISPPKSAAGRIHYPATTRTRITSSLAYKDWDEDVSEEDEENDDDTMRSKIDAKNETLNRNDLSTEGVIGESVTNVIYYNDLDVDDFNSSDIHITPPTITTTASTNTMIEIDDHELNDDNSYQSSIKPTSGPTYISPIQLMKKVPKGEPMSMTTFSFLKSLDDSTEKKDDGSSRSNSDPDPSAMNSPKSESNIESWKTKMSRNRPFQVSNYFETLNANATKGDDGLNRNSNSDSDDDNQNLLRSLRNQQAQLRTSQLNAMQQAMYNAMRRTNPKDAIARRLAKAQEESKKKEREKLERLYLVRKRRLDAKMKNEKLYLEERERQKKLLERRAGQRKEDDVTTKRDDAVVVDDKSPVNTKRGIPILDILSRPPVIDASPLLVGGTLTYQYTDLTPFQKRAVDLAIFLHGEHCARMKVDERAAENKAQEDGSSGSVPLPQAGDEGGIQAAPIIAIIDSYTGKASTLSPQQQQLSKTPPTRFATLASIEILKGSSSSSSDDGVAAPMGIKLTGVGRAYLRDYFSSKHAGSTDDEVELSKLLTSIHELDREHYDDDENDIASDRDMEADDDDADLPVVLAEFDIFLDDSSLHPAGPSGRDIIPKHRSSSVHAIAELYRTANKVYRLHEERKKLVAGLRAGVARLRLGKKKLAEEVNCSLEFEDCDNLGGLIGEVVQEMTTEWEEISTARSQSRDDIPSRSRLESMENYGFGSFGILSTIPDLTQQSMLQLEPYYSPMHRQREEYEAEVASMVIFRTLEMYADPDELAAALLSSSAIQRLELGYEVMLRHRNELNELVMMMSKDLIDCGEECTDLW